ncbi:MAG: DNA polymerase III subunit delta [Bacteroidota bacterium]
MSFDQILKAVKAKDFAPVYLLHGPEAYFIDQIEAAIEAHALQEQERAFNQTIIYGKEADHLQVVDAARRFPMMAERQLIILREAKDMRSLQQLVSYVEKPAATTVLVISHKHKKLNGNSKLAKALKANGVVFEAKPLYDNQVPDWIRARLKQKGYSIEPSAAELLGEFLGTSLSKITNELDKLLINLPKGTQVTTQVVEDQVGISKDFNVFELQQALGSRNTVKAFRIVQYFTANPKAGPLPMILGSLYNYFSKVLILLEMRAKQAPEKEVLSALKLRSNYFLREYNLAARNYNRAKATAVFALLHEYDLKSKGVGAVSAVRENGALLKELVYRILNV